MFISLTVKNFKTFKNETFFSMEREGQYRKVKNYINYYLAGSKKRENRLQLLKSALIMGNNQTGKTSLLEAMMALKDLVLTETFHYMPYAYNESPILMVAEFIHNEELYRYAVSYKEDGILAELLEVMNVSTQEYEIIFSKDEPHVVPVIQNYDVKQFFEKLIWVNDEVCDEQIQKLADAPQRQLCLTLLQKLGLDIVKIEVQNRLCDQKIKPHLFLYHAFNPKVAISLKDENPHLKKVMALLLAVLFNQEHAIYLMDDFDEGLYDTLASYLLYLLNAIDNDAQYIVTSHTPSLMDTDLSKDQIYILDRNHDEVYLSSLADDDDLFALRHNKKYSEGRFASMVTKEEWLSFLKAEL